MTDARYFMPDVEATADWSSYQDELVRRAVTHAAECAPEVRRRLEAAGVSPGEIRTVGDLARIPILKKDDLPARQAEDPPFGGMLAVPVDRLRRIYLSPGPIFDPEGDQPDFWRLAPALWAAGFRRGDIVQNTFAYHLTPAGAMLEEALRAIGCVVVPGGVGNTDAQVDLMARLEVTAYVGTPTFLLTLLEKAGDADLRLGLRRAFVSGAPLPTSLRERLQGEYGVEVYQGYGTADAGNLGYECETRDGWHVAPSVVLEIVDAATGEPVGSGETGEVVVTSPNETYPLVRFGTGDLSAFKLESCPCGRTAPRLVGFLGRVGEGVKVRGMFVHPRQLAQALRGVPAIRRYQAVVSRHEHRDHLTVKLEAEADVSLETEAVKTRVRDAIKLRVDVELVSPGTIAEDAATLVDIRKWE